MTRVLIVDDSPTARTLIAAILCQDPKITIVGEAEDGVAAVEATKRLKPDIITMDLLMPRLDGMMATKEIMIVQPTPIVIVSSTVIDEREAEIAIQALRAGAVAIARKPPGPDAETFASESQRLLETVKAMAEVRVVRHWRPREVPAGPIQHTPSSAIELHRTKPAIVAIATSTGGPSALQTLLTQLPRNFPVPILIVQHISPGFMSSFATWLNSICNLPVKIAEAGEKLCPHTVYLAPENHHLGVTANGRALLSQAPPIDGFRPSANFLFSTVASAYGATGVGLIMTGMGRDGVIGLKALHEKGGFIMAQDEASSVVFGMPGSSIAAGLVHTVLPLEQLPSSLISLICRSFT